MLLVSGQTLDAYNFAMKHRSCLSRSSCCVFVTFRQWAFACSNVVLLCLCAVQSLSRNCAVLMSSWWRGVVIHCALTCVLHDQEWHLACRFPKGFHVQVFDDRLWHAVDRRKYAVERQLCWWLDTCLKPNTEGDTKTSCMSLSERTISVASNELLQYTAPKRGDYAILQSNSTRNGVLTLLGFAIQQEMLALPPAPPPHPRISYTCGRVTSSHFCVLTSHKYLHWELSCQCSYTAVLTQSLLDVFKVQSRERHSDVKWLLTACWSTA